MWVKDRCRHVSTTKGCIAYMLVIIISLVFVLFVFTGHRNVQEAGPLSLSLNNDRPEHIDNNTVKFDTNASTIHFNETDVDHHVTKILLVAYFRGGSTYLGEAFNSNRDVFYWFEPLITIKQPNVSMVEEIYIKSKNGGIKYPTHSTIIASAKTLHNIFTCQLGSLDGLLLKHSFQTNWMLSNKLIPYTKCMKSLGTNSSVDATTTCLPRAIEACNKSQVRVIKTIRFGLFMTNDLLRLSPDVKIIYYVRDPRGTINSRLHFYMETPLYYLPVIRTEARMLCQRMYNDLNAIKEMTSRNVMIVVYKYEDLATHPLDVIQAIYQDVSLEVPGSVLRYLDMVSSATKDAPGHMSMLRKNSAVTAFNWRHILPAQCQKVIRDEPICVSVLKKFDYEI